MRLVKFKLLTVTVLFLLVSQTTHVLAETGATTGQTGDTTASRKDTASSQTQSPAPQAQTPAPQVYRGYPPPRYYRRHDRGWVRPFGDDGPAFHGPWRKGRGSGFGFGSGDGPSWGSGSGPWWDSEPRFRRYDDWDRDPFRDRFHDDPFLEDPFYDRGPRYYDRGPRYYDRGRRGWDDWDWDSHGMSFGW